MFCPNGCRDGECLQPSPPRVCNYNGDVYQVGDTFKSSDGCNKCYCNADNSVACTEMACVDYDSGIFCISGNDRYKPGDSFMAPDGCNKCHCDENGNAACTRMACPPPPQIYPNPTDPTDPDHRCYSSQDCGQGTICSVELGDCNSGPCDASGICADVCSGFCVSRPTSNDGSEYEDEVRTAPLNRFSDIDSSTLEGQAANALANSNVIGGFADGTFGGGKSVNRAEAAKFILMARFGSVPEARNDNLFLDVLEGEWYVKYVVYAANLGVISGYSDRMFRPANTVNTAEFLKMITNAFGLQQDISYNYSDVPEGAWFAKFAGVAQTYDLFPGRPTGQLQPERLLTRGEVAIAIYKLMENR